MGILNLTLTLTLNPSPITNPKYMDVHLEEVQLSGNTYVWRCAERFSYRQLCARSVILVLGQLCIQLCWSSPNRAIICAASSVERRCPLHGSWVQTHCLRQPLKTRVGQSHIYIYIQFMYGDFDRVITKYA